MGHVNSHCGYCNMYKRAILLISVWVLSILFWVWAKPWIENPLRLSWDERIWLKPLIVLIIFVAVQGLAVLLVGSRPWRWGIILISTLPYFAVFEFGKFYWTVLPVTILLQMYVGHAIHTEVAERTKINIRQIMDRGLPSLVTSILVMVSLAFFLSPATQAAARQQELPFATKTIVEKSVSIFAGEQLQNLPPEQRNSFLNQTTGEVLKQFNSILKPYFKYFPPILAFGLFLILQGLSFIFVWLATLMATGLFAVFKKSGFVRIKIVQKEAEELEV